MTERPTSFEEEKPAGAVNPGYAALQLAKALKTSEDHVDQETRERAKARVARWETVLIHALNGSVAYGSRTPVDGAPAWATLEVVTGGFATGKLLGEGPLQPHEEQLLNSLGSVHRGDERRALNAHFLTDAGFAELQQRLRVGCYDISIPEEGALLVVAWLTEKGFAEEARGLLEAISSHFGRLRFYPIPLERPRRFGSRVYLQNVQQTIAVLDRIQPNKRILTQREAVEVWAPFMDKMVTAFLDTFEDGWPCKKYSEGWANRALALEEEYAELRVKHTLCRRIHRSQGHFAQLRTFLSKCAREPESLSGREIGRIRLILNRYLEKHGRPGSSQCVGKRRRQQSDVAAPLFHDIGRIVKLRLQPHVSDEGLDDVSHLCMPVTADEAGSCRW
jgi:hypothetical protein